MSRACPLCPQQPLRVLTLRGVEVDRCEHCQGMWLEAGALERLVPGWEARSSLALLDTAPGRCLGGHPLPGYRERCTQCEAGPALCPDCGVRLALEVTPACAIDVCRECHGLWLDAHELAAIRRSLRKEERSESKPAAEEESAWGWGTLAVGELLVDLVSLID